MSHIAFGFALAVLAIGGGDEETKTKPFELVLKTTAMVRGAEVRISDLADVVPAGEAALQIGQVVFGRPPIPGYTRSVTRNEMLQSLVAAGHQADRFTFRGPSEVVVQGVTTELPAIEIAEAANAVLQAVLAQEGSPDVETEIVTRIRHIAAPAGRQSQELKARVRDGQAGQSMAIVDVDVLVDGERFKTIPVQYKLARFHKVLKTVGPVRNGTPLGPENLTLSREKVSETSGLYLRSFEDIEGLIARRNLQGSQLLTISDVGEPALIRRGEIVTVILTRGRIKVTAKAIANHDAARGEMVSLTNMQSRAQITGVAAAPGTVIVPTGH